MDIQLSEAASDLLTWLSDNPGRRVQTGWSSDPQRVRVNGERIPGSEANAHGELLRHGLLKPDGDGWRWKLSPKGILLSGVRSGRLKTGAKPGRAKGRGRHRKQRCTAVKLGGKPCWAFAQRGSPYCAAHPNGSPKPKPKKTAVVIERPDKLSPSAKKNRKRTSPPPQVEIPPSRSMPPGEPQELRRLPEVSEPQEVAPCERHGARLCSQPECLAAEEASQLHQMAGKRLLAARPAVY